MAAHAIISFQLHSAREFGTLDDQLAILAEIGYRHVETVPTLTEDAAATREALDRHGMAAPTGHFALTALTEDFDATVATAHTLGTQLVVIPFLPPEARPRNAAGWRGLAARISDIRRRLADHGLACAWHNHDFELVAQEDGSVPLDLLLGGDAALKWEADIGWIRRAGAAPQVWLDRYAGRVAALHIKDLAPEGENLDEDGWADVGHGTIDWEALWPTCLATAAPWFIVEHDNPSDFARFARRSFETLTALGAVPAPAAKPA